MTQLNAAPFPTPVTFPDVDAAILAREDIAVRSHRTLISGGAWHSYMRKVLPPLPAVQPDGSDFHTA